MDLKYLMSNEKIINEILKDESENICFFKPLKLYLESLILYVRSEKATEDSLYEEIYKISLLPMETQEMIFSEKKEKDYYVAFEYFSALCTKKTRQTIVDIVSCKIHKKLKENI